MKFTNTTASSVTNDVGMITWTSGEAVTAASYQFGRDADSTNQMHLNVPTGASFEFSINDVAQMVWNATNIKLISDLNLTFGTTIAAGTAALVQYDTTQTVDSLLVGLDETSRTLHLCDYGDIGFDFALAAQTNPALAIHSAAQSTTQYILLFHNGTDARITAGLGKLKLSGAADTTSITDRNGNVMVDFTSATNASSAGIVTTFPAINGNNIVPSFLDYIWQANTGAGGQYTASTEVPFADFNMGQTHTWQTGALTTQRFHKWTMPTVAFGGASTLTNNIGFSIDKAPGAGSNATVTNTYLGQFGGSVTIGATSASMTYGIFDFPAHTVTVTGSTQVTSACGFALERLGQLTITDSSAVTIDNAAAHYIADAPVAAGSVTLANKYAYFADAGLSRFDGGVVFAASGQSTLSNYTEGTFTPTVTLVGGAGNTVPVYSTNTGRYTRIGNRVFVDVYLTGDGGDEGAGTGTVNIALPVAASASNPAGARECGRAINNVSEYLIAGEITGGASTVSLSYYNLISTTAAFTGADQNNATRTIRLQFFYEV